MPPAATAGKAKPNGKGHAAKSGATPNGETGGNGSSASADNVKRQLLGALRAVARGDFTVKLPRNWDGIDGDIAEAFNEVVSMDARTLTEIDRISTVVGHDGRLGQRADLQVPGSWGAKLVAINRLIDDLTHPIAETNRVLGAVARGDLSQQMALEHDGRPLKGEFLRSARTINAMVDQLNAFAGEVTRVAREVGSEGILGGQAHVRGVAGTWKDLTDSVNSMAGTLTNQIRNIADVTTAVANGNLSKKITVEARGEILQLKETINTMVDQLNTFAAEVTRVAREVGSEGRLGGQADVRGVAGTWKDLTDSVNTMAGNLTSQVRNIAEVTTAVAKGDLSKKITVDVRGEVLELKGTINTMVDQLNAFAGEVTRVAREVGTDGRLGGQAVVEGVGGTWKDLTDSVNTMARNLTAQVRNIAEVTTAVAKGDLSKKITVDVKGEVADLKVTVNTMVDQLNAFAGEVTRVAREVGTEGRLGGQAQVEGVAGTWKDLTDSVNTMAANLTAQVRNIAEVTTAVANGDLSKKITVSVRGEVLELKTTINTMVDQLNSFAAEVTRVAREVGTDGRLGGQADVRGVAGTWKDLTDSVNSMAGNLTNQVRNIAAVTTAVARGDLSKKITVDVKGEMLELKATVNTMVDQLNAFASEVTRMAREVGTDGKLGGQAQVEGVAGTWKDLTDSVNSMAANLTNQVRNIADVTTAVANGDLSKKITVDVRGEMAELKNTVNTMVDQLNAFASEVTRVAREVGSEGRLGGQAYVQGVAGTWKDLTDNVNFMASNLTSQVRNIADVTTAVAKGDLSKKITVDVKGEMLELKATVNTMVDQLNAFAAEVTRVAREVGTDGKLGGQAVVPGVGGTWKDLTDSVNSMASSLTAQVRNIADVTTAVARGDLSKKITVDARGEILELKGTVNTMVDQLNAFAGEVTRVAREVGSEGILGGQAQVQGVSGTWKDLTDSVNSMAANLTNQVRNIAKVTTAVANGDLSKKVTVDVRGEMLELKDTINTMVDQLNSFAAEVTRVAREVGSDGILGGQAQVPGVAGTWKDLTDSVNRMAGNLTNQVRGIAKVVTSVANGDLQRKLVLDAKGEIAELGDTINGMIDTLAIFADQVTSVAREVGFEGRLGGQAEVPGAAGLWRDLTDSVNQLGGPAHLADPRDRRGRDGRHQGRSLAHDRGRRAGRGRPAHRERERDDPELARHDAQEPRDGLAQDQPRAVLRDAAGPERHQAGREAHHDRARAAGERAGRPLLPQRADRRHAAAALHRGLRGAAPPHDAAVRPGRRARRPVRHRERARARVDVPPDYVQVTSGAGHAQPLNIVVLPVLFEDDIKAVIELGSFEKFSDNHLLFLDQLTQSIGIVLNTIAANMRTEELLKQSHGAHHRAAVAAGRAPADQRGARRESAPPRRAERRGREAHPRDRGSAPRARAEGRAARAHLEVQVAVPRQHVARAAHAAQLAADPLEAAQRQQGAEPQQQAGRDGADDPARRLRPAHADQRHPRPLEDRVGDDVGRHHRAADQRHLRRRRADVPRRRAGARVALRDPRRRRSAGLARDRPDASHADPQEPALERVQVHRARLGRALAHARRARDRRERRPRSSPSRCTTPASGSRSTSTTSSSRRSSKPTCRRPASTAGPGSASRSRARSPVCSAATWRSSRNRARDRRSPSSIRSSAACAVSPASSGTCRRRRSRSTRTTSRWRCGSRRGCRARRSTTTATRSSRTTASCSSSKTMRPSRGSCSGSRATAASRD